MKSPRWLAAALIIGAMIAYYLIGCTYPTEIRTCVVLIVDESVTLDSVPADSATVYCVR